MVSRLLRTIAGALRAVPLSERVWTARNPGNSWHRFDAVDLSPPQAEIVDRFHDLFYSRAASRDGLRSYFVSWLGYELFKCPLDLWVYQEIISRERPAAIVETGTYKGGSALFLATICDLIGHGEVITIDIDGSLSSVRPRHPRITYLTGSSVDPRVFALVEKHIGGRSNVLVILDSDHSRDHVLSELRLYRRLVPPGGYVIVEDTNINGHPTYGEFGPGPWEAVDCFLSEDKDFYADRSCERFLLTMNPRGFLRRRSRQD